MQYRKVGKSGVRVSQLCFGTMSFGGDADEATSALLYKRCREAGINFFDCANGYAGGRSEEILGKLVKGERDDLVLTSKVYFPQGKDVNARGATRRHIMQQIDISLRRLQTDRLDFYFIHHFDNDTPLEETLRALDDLVSAGKILYPAASNFAAWQVAKALGISERHGWAPFALLQPLYNLLKRQAEVEILPLAASEGLGVISYSPLAGGLLTGKYALNQPATAGRFAQNRMYQLRYGDEGVHETANAFSDLARRHGYDPAALAVAWVGSHPALTAPIIGARNVEQLEGSLKSLEIEMTPELRAEVEALTPEPPPATDRSEVTKGMKP